MLDIDINLESIQKFLEDNNLGSKTALKHFNFRVYHRAQKFGLLDKLKFSRKFNHWKDITSLEDVQNYIDENSIESYSQLTLDCPGLCKKIRQNGWTKKLNFKIKSTKVYSWTDINTVEDLNKFIEENNISSTLDLRIRFAGLYDKAHNLKILDLSKLSSSRTSHGEYFIKRYIEENISNDESYFDFLRFSKKFTGIDGRNEQYVCPDFLFEYKDNKYWIEYNGEQHYHRNRFFNKTEGSFEKQLERDKSIKEFCNTDPEDLFITYIEVPYTINTYESISKFLDQVIKGGVDPNNLIDYKNL